MIGFLHVNCMETNKVFYINVDTIKCITEGPKIKGRQAVIITTKSDGKQYYSFGALDIVVEKLVNQEIGIFKEGEK